MKIVWLASYPKSGNTWLRFFLYSYLFGDIENSEDVARKFPDIHKIGGLDTSVDTTALVKTHWLFGPEHRYIENTAAAIYIVRHPKDVLLSSLNYCRMEGDWELDDEQFARSFMKNLGVAKWKNVGIGSWPAHIDSWINGTRAARIPLMMLRYEDMLRAPEDSFSKVIDFLRIPRAARKMRRALSQSSFESLNELEKSEKRSGVISPVFTGQQADSPGHSFMNRGQAGRNLAAIADELDAEFDAVFAEYLARYGYAPN